MKSGAARYRAKHLRKGRARTAGGRRAAPTSPENRAVIRLVICGVIFVALVAVKLLFPEAVSRLADTAGALIGRDADFQEAFAAMGRAISGEEAVSDSLQDAYAAVFSPGAVTEENSGAETEEGAAEGGGVPQTPNPADPSPGSTMTASPETAPPETAGDGGTGTESAEETGETGEAAGNMPEETGPAASDTEAEPASSAPADPQEISGTEGETADDTATQTLSYVYTMPALPANASLEQRNLGFAYQSPILGALSSTFGWRDHPVDGENKFHYGVDLAAEEGADICAFADGEVYATGESSTLGNYIMLEHPGGYITLYAHCSRVTVTGGAVSMGDKIAEVGQTGVATGPHLHFELHDGSLYLNPIYYVQVR